MHRKLSLLQDPFELTTSSLSGHLLARKLGQLIGTPVGKKTRKRKAISAKNTPASWGNSLLILFENNSIGPNLDHWPTGRRNER